MDPLSAISSNSDRIEIPDTPERVNYARVGFDIGMLFGMHVGYYSSASLWLSIRF